MGDYPWYKVVWNDFLKFLAVIIVVSLWGFGLWKMGETYVKKSEYNQLKYQRCLGECAPYEPVDQSRTAMCVCNMLRVVPDAIPTRDYGTDDK